MKILYRLRFIPLVLLILLFILTVLSFIGYFAIVSVVALPYQDPTAEMLIAQAELYQELWDGIPRVLGLVGIAFGAMVLYIIFLVILSRRRKRREAIEVTEEI